MKKTFQDCKDEVARERNCESWMIMEAAYVGAAAADYGDDWLYDTMTEVTEQAADLYATEAIKADRARIIEDLTSIASIVDTCVDVASVVGS